MITPAIFSALQDQSGLKLTSSTSSVDHLDHTGKPSSLAASSLDVPFGTSTTTLSRSLIDFNTGATDSSAIFNDEGTITATNNF